MYELKKFLKVDAGATAIEYGLVAIVGIVASTVLGNAVLTSFAGI